MIERVLIDIHSGFYIVPTLPAVMTIGQNYYTQLLAVGGVGRVTFSVLDGALPSGMMLYTAGGQPIAPQGIPEAGSVQGTPNTPYMIGSDGTDARARYTIRGTDQAGNVADLSVVQEVVWPEAPQVMFAPGRDVMAFALSGGPDDSDLIPQIQFDPALPNNWPVTHSNNNHNALIDTSGGGTWAGRAYWDLDIAGGQTFLRVVYEVG